MPFRVFLAIPVPPGVRDVLAEVMGQLKVTVRPHVRWARPEGVHMTLHFLGQLEEAALSDLYEAVSPLAVRFRTAEAELTGIGFFPDDQHPRVVWVGAREPTGSVLQTLREDLGKVLEQRGIDVDHRPWSPHLTLARLEAPVPAEAFQARIPAARFLVDRFCLYRSDLEPGGARYTLLRTFPLTGV